MKKTRFFALALFISMLSKPVAAQIRLSYSVVGPTVAGIWMAHDNGIFKKYGLDVQLVYIPSSGTNIQALLGGSLDMSAPGISGVVLAAARGAPVLAIGAMTNRPPMTLYVHPEITRTEQLKGADPWHHKVQFDSSHRDDIDLAQVGIGPVRDYASAGRPAGDPRSNKSRLPGW